MSNDTCYNLPHVGRGINKMRITVNRNLYKLYSPQRGDMNNTSLPEHWEVTSRVNATVHDSPKRNAVGALITYLPSLFRGNSKFLS